MIRIICRTNLDDYKREDWPTEISAPPQVGQYIEAKSGKRLRVVSVCWLYSTRPRGDQMEVELHR